MAAVSTATQREVTQLLGNQVVQVPGVSWATYKQLNNERGEQPGTQLTFSEGVLQIMSLGPTHERLSYDMAKIVDILCETLMPDFQPLGSTTMSREDLEKGFEPDECYYFTHLEEVRALTKISLDVDPPPDLIVEIDITNSSLNRLPLFAAVGVSEVWRYEDQAIKIYQLQSQMYVESEHSRWFPPISAAQLAEWLVANQTMLRGEWLQKIRDEIQAA